MMCRLPSLVVVGSLLFSGAAHAEEPAEAQLEFVRKLRAKGYSDLALEHLEKLKKSANPALQNSLQLEIARTLLSVARDKEPEQRSGLFNAARTELEAFVQKNAGSPEGAQARLEIARIAAFQGQSLLSRAVREDDPAIARQAEQKFIQAGQELEAAAKLLGELVANYKDPDSGKEKRIKEQMEQERLQARFDRGKNFLDQATTYLYTAKEADNRKRAEVVDEARKAFESIAEDGGPTGLLAAAWLIKVHHEATTPQEATKFYKRVLASAEKSAQPAQRWARLFNIQIMAKGADAKKIKLVEDECKKWLAAYPAHLKSPEGLAVRYEYGKTLFLQAQGQTKEGKAPPAAAMTLYNLAQKHLAAVAESDSELSEQANQFNVQISIMKMGEKTAVSDLRDFDECFLKAQVELYRMREAAKKANDPKSKDAEKAEADRKKHLKEVNKALVRGLRLADQKTPPGKLEDARFFLATSFMLSGDQHRAAVAYESLGRAKPPGKRSASSAAYALQTYADVMQRDADGANRFKLKDLADYVLSPEMQKAWSSDPVTSIALYQMAMLYSKDDDFKNAIAHLDKLPRDFSGYLYAKGQQVFIAMEGKEKAKTEEEKAAFLAAARKAVKDMPELTPDADPNTGAMYFYAQAEYPKFLYADAGQLLATKDVAKAGAKYQEMATFSDGLRAKLDKSPVKISVETRDKIGFVLGVMSKYAKLGLADIDYRNGKYDEVLKNIADTVAKVEAQKGDGKSAIKMKDYQLTGEILGLALRANVQKGAIARAREILRYLERLTGDEEGLQAETTNVLRSLIVDLQGQVRELKKNNDTKKLAETIKNFSAFIDDLAAQAQTSKKGLDLNDVRFLATFYSTLEQYDKAATLYAKIPPPKSLEGEKIDEKDEKDVVAYWDLQVQYAKALRMSAKGKEDLGKARKVLDDLLRHKHARQQILADIEQNLILEDADLHGLAIKGWGAFLKNMGPRIGENPALKELYFQGYFYNTRCLFKYSQSKTVQASGKESVWLKTAASQIIRLENSMNQEGWQIAGPMFQDLLRNEKKLKDVYDESKKAAK